MLRGTFWEFVRIFGWIPLTLLKVVLGAFAIACCGTTSMRAIG